MIFVVAALAQVPISALDAENYHPVIDSDWTTTTDDAIIRAPWSFRAELTYQRDPLRYVQRDTGRSIAVIHNALALNLSGSGAIGPVRVGAMVPAYLLVTGDLGAPHSVLGDPSLDVKVQLYRSSQRTSHLALSGAIDIPLGASRAQLGSTSPAVRLGAIGDVLIKRWFAALNVGVHLTEAQHAVNVRLGNGLFLRAAVGYRVSRNVGLTLESHTQLGWLRDSTDDLRSEILLGVHQVTPAPISPYASIGTGLTSGVGSPVFRGIVGLRFGNPNP